MILDDIESRSATFFADRLPLQKNVSTLLETSRKTSFKRRNETTRFFFVARALGEEQVIQAQD